MRVCLASTSPARLALLRQSGIEPICVSPDVDEDAVAAAEAERLGRPLAPEEVVLLLGRAKAAEVAGRIHELDPGFEGIVIGGDSMFEIDGAVHGKPHEPARAIARWHAMRGRTGVLHSGHSVILVRPDAPAEEVHAVAEAAVTFAADVDDAEIEAYVATGSRCSSRSLHGGQPGRRVHRARRGRPLHGRRDVAVDPASPRRPARDPLDRPLERRPWRLLSATPLRARPTSTRPFVGSRT